jgi:hypothetical protein
MDWREMLRNTVPSGRPINYEKITEKFVCGTIVEDTILTPFSINLTEEKFENFELSKIKLSISNRNRELYLFKNKRLFFELYLEVYFKSNTIKIIRDQGVRLDEQGNNIFKTILLHLKNEFCQREMYRLPLLLGSMNVVYEDCDNFRSEKMV